MPSPPVYKSKAITSSLVLIILDPLILRSLLNQGKVEILCPLPECRADMSVESIDILQGTKLLEKLRDFQAQRFVPSEGERLLNCPTPGVSEKPGRILVRMHG